MNFTQESADKLLIRLQGARKNVEHLTALEPILKAAAAGEQIQYLVGGIWVDMSEATFCDPAQYYRVKPKTVKIKHFWWRSSFGGKSSLRIDMANESQQTCDPRENWSTFVSWIDEDWVEYEIPQVKP